MHPLSARLQSLSPSETFAMAQKSNELKAQGIDVINMSVGEPDFSTPYHIKEAAKEAIDRNFSFYSPVAGFPELRRAICTKLKNENGLDFDPARIVVSNGAKQSLCNVILTIVNKGEEVIIPAPYWVSYPEMVKIAEGKPVYLYAGIEQEYKITAKQLEAAITPNTRALILCSPSNPTGSVYTREELQSLAEVLERYPDIYIISDEIYEKINYVGKHESIAQFEPIRERVIVVNGVSKGYAMTGWRIGWIAAAKWIATACGLLQGQYTSGPSSISQKAAEAAYTGSQDCVEEMRLAFERRKNLITRLLKEIPDLKVNDPKGAFYTFVECSRYLGKVFGEKRIDTATDLAMFLLEEGHVACVGGDAFGAPGHLRFSYATSDEKIEAAISRVKEALKKLR
ncbi:MULTISPECIES: pyridoxal phosphate-dependent aminotransferase [Petrimonas]|jgi:aspartate aminotransferase|uniref:Aminotransferase n=1 Tax=Petrimonas mucosa TaxID=1642646 RepID=A0A1G4GBG8_9BACT|nr:MULTISPECIES: pyridoxal phosphate-dependent aminotransferase [Petrimonas]MDD3561116.1 pyridoxal phosphate-dependent aminotransferase [Petrimonas mucosa]SCM59821.1 Aspartate aminotransferase [Petrimonas mucosa]SFU60945.1 aspartate aminotransferase [Porphyromonadaceae bacterium KHP3R9]